MFRRIFLALAFVTAFGVIGLSMAETASAHGGSRFGPRFGQVSYGGWGGGGYAAASYRMHGFYGGYGHSVGYHGHGGHGHGGHGFHYDLVPHYNHFDVVPHYGGHHHGGIFIGF